MVTYRAVHRCGPPPGQPGSPRRTPKAEEPRGPTGCAGLGTQYYPTRAGDDSRAAGGCAAGAPVALPDLGSNRTCPGGAKGRVLGNERKTRRSLSSSPSYVIHPWKGDSSADLVKRHCSHRGAALASPSPASRTGQTFEATRVDSSLIPEGLSNLASVFSKRGHRKHCI